MRSEEAHCGLARGEWSAEQIALVLVAAQPLQGLELSARLHSLGSYLQLEAVRHGNHGVDDGGDVGTGGAAAEHVTAGSKPIVTVPATPLTRPAAPVLPPLPPIPDEVAPSLPSATSPDLAPALAASGIPSRALDAYKRDARLVDAADPGCGID